jgi:endonuclease-3
LKWRNFFWAERLNPLSKALSQLTAIIEFRKHMSAPVGTMGCSKLGDTSDAKLYRFQTMIALMLSSQTKDELTSKAIRNLKTLPGGLTAATLSTATVDVVQGLIRRVSFFPTKAAELCSRDHDRDIPRTIADLVAIPGVGIKMATLAMAHVWDDKVGIGVGVHRIADRLGWVKTNHPDKTEVELQKLFPKDVWGGVNGALVGFGQTICAGKRPKCGECPIADSCAWGGDDNDIEDEPKPKPKGKAAMKRGFVVDDSESDDEFLLSDSE